MGLRIFSHGQKNTNFSTKQHCNVDLLDFHEVFRFLMKSRKFVFGWLTLAQLASKVNKPKYCSSLTLISLKNISVQKIFVIQNKLNVHDRYSTECHIASFNALTIIAIR